MKILQVIPYFSPAYAFGGPVTAAYEIAKELVKRGHEVVVYTSDAKDSFSRLSDIPRKAFDGITVHYFKNLTLLLVRSSKLFITPQIIRHSKKEVKEFDVIHLHEYRTFQNTVVHHYATKHSVPYVLQAHGSLPRIIAKQRLKTIYDAFFGYRLLRDASKVIALTSMEAKQYRSVGVPDEKISLIPNGVDLSECPHLPPKGAFKKKFSIDDGEKIVLYLGRIHRSKGLDLLAHAFKIVATNFNNVRLVIAGPNDGYEATLSRLISDLGLREKAVFTGFVDRQDKMAALVDSDIFVTPRFYGFPITFLEACLAECPIVTTSTDLDWVHNNVGYVAENSSAAVAKAISEILRNERISGKFRNNCKSTVKNFDFPNLIAKLEDVYASLQA